MKSNENIILICNCHTLYTSHFLLSDVSRKVNNKIQKIQCTSKTKIAVITQQKIHVFNSITQIDNQDVSKDSQSVIKSSFYDIIHQSIFSLKYHDKIPILVEDKEKIEKILKSEQRPLHKFNPFGVVLLNQQSKVILFKSLWIFFLSRVSKEPGSNEMKRYIEDCAKQKKVPNKNFIKIMCQIISKPDFTFQIDPLILSGVREFDQQSEKEEEEMRELFNLTSSLQFKRAQLMFELVNKQIIELGIQFLSLNKYKLELISFKNCKLSDQGFRLIIHHMTMMNKLMEINLSGNNFTDDILQSLGKMVSLLPRLIKLHLDKNKIRFNNSIQIFNFIKNMEPDFQLSLQHNQINDESTDLIISLIILADETPIKVLNLSFNKFSMFGVYKLIVSSGQVPMIVYVFPIPLNPELIKITKIFQEEKQQQVKQLKFEDNNESVQQKDNQNNQQRKRKRFVIKISRKKYTNKKLPCSLKQKQIAKNNVQYINTAIAENIPIQKLLELCQYIFNFQFEMPMTLMKNLYQYIWQKYNEALLIRVCLYNQDHYSIQFLKDCCPFIGISLSHFQAREEKVQERKNIILNKIHKLFNLQYNDNEYNQQLEEIIKESLRLDLRGQAIQMLYVLKIRRDEIIHQLLQSGYGFEQVQYEGKQLDLDEMLKQAQLSLTYPPQLLKLQLDCNWYKKWYLVDWKQIINFSKQNENVLKQSMIKLSENQSMQQFTYLILDRYRFLKNDFFQYDRKLWLGLYNQKMINMARLLNLSGDAQYNSRFVQLNLKILIHPQTILNLPNIKKKVCDFRIQDYEHLVINQKQINYAFMEKLSNFKSQPANKQFANMMNILKEIIQQVKKDSSINFYILIIDVIKFIRNAVFVDFLIEELYLHLLFFTRQKYPDLLIGILPVLTHYLPLPRLISKQFLNFVIERLPLNLKAVQFTYNQHLLEKNITKHSTIENIVYRDWIPRVNELPSLVKNYMKFSLKIQTPSISFTISVLDSNFITQVVAILRKDEHLQNIMDLSLFWLFQPKEFDDEPLFPKDYIGQIVSRWTNENPNYLIYKRRIYSPFYYLQLQVMNSDNLNEIFNSTKRQFLLGKYKSTNLYQLCSIVHYCNFKGKVRNQNGTNLLIEEFNSNIEDWMPRNILKNNQKKEYLKKETKLKVMELNFINSNLRQLKITMLKRLLIGTSLYIFNPQDMYVIGVNFWGVYLFSNQYLEIPMNHILSIITEAQGLQIRYFTLQKEQEIHVKMNERIAYFFYQDFISYVDMQLKYPTTMALKILYKEMDNEQQSQRLMGLGTVILKNHYIFEREEQWVKRNRMRYQRLQKWFEKETQKNQEVQKLLAEYYLYEQVEKEKVQQNNQLQKVQDLMFRTSNQLDEALKLFKSSKQGKKKEVDEEEHLRPLTIQQIIQQKQQEEECDIIRHLSLARRTLKKR